MTYPMKPLTGCAMAVFARQWLVPTQLILYFSAMALPLPLYVKFIIILMNAIRSSEFPLVLVSVRRLASLELVGLLAVVVLAHLGVLVWRLLVLVLVRELARVFAGHCERSIQNRCFCYKRT